MKIPFHRPDLPQDLNEIYADSIRNGWLTTGSQVEKFEYSLKEFFGSKHVIAVNSCTAALHLGMLAKGFKPGDKFIVPTHTFVSTVECGEYLGMEPIFVDCQKDGFNLDLNQVEDLIKKDPKIKAIVPVHYGGIPVDMKQLMKMSEKSNIYILEDSAHALETISSAGKVGNTNHAAAFSFYANKNLTTFGEGGALATNDSDLAKKVKNLSLHGITKDGWKRFEANAKWEYDIINLGYKYNMSDISASYGIWQLKQINDWHRKRTRIAKTYINELKNIDGIVCPKADTYDGNAWHLFVIQIDRTKWNISRNKIIELLNDKGIGLSVHYKPIHMLDYYQKKFGYKPSDFPRSKSLFESVISIPLYPNLTEKETSYIIDSIRELAHLYLN